MFPADRCQSLQLLLLDVDGILTDGSVLLDSQGGEIKRFHVRDGSAIKWWRKWLGPVGIVSGRSSPAVEQRGKELGIEHIYQGIPQKWLVVEKLLEKLQLTPDSVCYLGDDLPDVPVLRRVGLAITVADAPQEVRDSAHWVTSRPGGKAAVREAIEAILKARGDWDSVLAAVEGPDV
ncbi:Phenylphosphate carboxylase subunit delta [Planctomycetales bacterium 10988]|nr:Phenylphosphate carboxylase subunit delta [Planctomycetales bacterium 10988]